MQWGRKAHALHRKGNLKKKQHASRNSTNVCKTRELGTERDREREGSANRPTLYIYVLMYLYLCADPELWEAHLQRSKNLELAIKNAWLCIWHALVLRAGRISSSSLATTQNKLPGQASRTCAEQIPTCSNQVVPKHPIMMFSHLWYSMAIDFLGEETQIIHKNNTVR